MRLNLLFLGKCHYDEALKIQYDILEKRQQNIIEDTLIIVEHPPVITLGRHATKGNIMVSAKYLEDQKIQLYETDRGGDVTYHGYGQIVGYPIVDLKSKKMGIRQFVDKLEEVFIQLLKDKYNITAERSLKHTGVWVENSKIAAVGLAVKRGITMHGFAFNVNTKLEHFNLIVPCGISNKGVTSIENILKKPVELKNVNQWILEYFLKIFNYEEYQELSIKESIGR
ncbi:lipoyl(octanoyl) transferase LipB [Natronincola peptidivorans]|nr:lipoyl(octanoyl) transferase LipB [Natronincola peptidivorans]